MERNALKDFTYEERKTIDDILRRNFAGMTPDEVALYGEWMQVRGKIDAEVTARNEALAAETAAAIEQRAETEKAAREALRDMRDAALERYKAVTDGQ